VQSFSIEVIDDIEGTEAPAISLLRHRFLLPGLIGKKQAHTRIGKTNQEVTLGSKDYAEV
jgi:hypothetical protein